MNEEQKAAAKKLDDLWGTGVSAEMLACVEATDRLIKAAEEQPDRLGLYVPKEDTQAASLCVGSVCGREGALPGVSIELCLKHKVEKPTDPDLWIVSSPGMTKAQHVEVKSRWEQYRILMGAAAVLQQQAHGVLTGSVQEALAERRAATEARRAKRGT